jgi:hypothetical protein
MAFACMDCGAEDVPEPFVPAPPPPAPAPAPGERVHEQFAPYQRESEFAAGLESLINRYSQENGSNTPDFILACYLVRCLAAFNEASRARETWYGKSLHI